MVPCRGFQPPRDLGGGAVAFPPVTRTHQTRTPAPLPGMLPLGAPPAPDLLRRQLRPVPANARGLFLDAVGPSERAVPAAPRREQTRLESDADT